MDLAYAPAAAKGSQRAGRFSQGRDMRHPPPNPSPRSSVPLMLARAVKLHQEGRRAQAEVLYRSILAWQPRHFEASHFLGLIRHEQGDHPEAARYLAQAVQIRPDDLNALTNHGAVLATLNDPEAALASFDRALAVAAQHPDALNGRANMLMRLGRPADALASFESLLAVKPGHVDALNNRGIVLMALGRPADALESYDRALAISPNLVEVINNRGVALRALNRSEDALASFDGAIAIRPEYAEALNNRGVTLRDLGRPDEALASFERALAFRPDYVEALNNRGIELRDLGRAEEALACLDRALAIQPDYPEALNNRAAALRSLHRPLEALACLDRLLAIRPDHAEALNNRGGALKDLERLEEALASFEAAIAVRPGYAEAHDNRGVVLTVLGRLDEASEAVEQAIRLSPRRIRGYYNLAGTRRLRPGDPQIQAMEDLARDMPSLTAAEQIDLNFALAKALADIGDHAGSFQRLLAGNALKRAQNPYDEAATLEVFERTQAAFTGQVMRQRQGLGDPSAVPAFIIGMPRSGTTLVEQILASHPDVFGAGEIGAFGEAVQACDAATDGAASGDHALAALSGEALRRLGADYLGRTRPLAPAARRITNKMPGNFFFAGAIHLALPNARIIHLRRDPVDTCLSCFSKLFTEDLAYAYDLGELGRYYRAYDGLMAHWRAVLPEGVMLEVRYEDIVADLEGEARRIVAHCGLDWDARCLDFHLTKRTVATASAAQVRQPIYHSSVGRWRVLEPFLGPLLAEIGPTPPVGIDRGASADAA